MSKTITRIFVSLMLISSYLFLPLSSIIALDAPIQSLDVNGVNIFNQGSGYNSSHGIEGISYDVDTHTLTMNNAAIERISSSGDLDINLVGTNSISAVTDSSALLAMGGDLTITGDLASLTISALAPNQPAITIGAGGRLTVGAAGTSITVTVMQGILMNCEDTFIVDGNTLSLPTPDGPGEPPLGNPLQIFVDGFLAIDEGSDPQVTSASGLGWSIEQGFMGIYQMNVDSGTSVGYITGSGDGALSISSTDGSFTILENEDSRSINMAGNVFILLGTEEGNINLVGGIYTEGEVLVRDGMNVSIGSLEVPSLSGISSSGVYVGTSDLSIYTSGTALQYFNETPLEGVGMIVESGQGHSLTVFSSNIATANVSIVRVSGGGTIDLSYNSSLGNFTPEASHWPWTDMTGTEEENPLPIIVPCEEGTDFINKYVMTSNEGNFLLESTAGTLYQLGWNIPDAPDSIVTNGTVRVIAANGYRFTSGGYTDYSIEAGSEVTIELLPDYGYQYVSGGLNGNQTAPDAGKASYTFTMPEGHLHLSAIFERSSDIVKLETNILKSASLVMPSDEINGNAELVIDEATGVQEEKFVNVAGGYEVDTFLDISLNEVIYKGSTDEVWRTNLTELEDNSAVTLSLSDELKGHAEYKVLRDHEGVVEVLDAVYNPSTGTLTFDTDSFSTYAIAFNDEANPNTYDNISIFVIIGLVSMLGISGILIYEGRNKYGRQQA